MARRGAHPQGVSGFLFPSFLLYVDGFVSLFSFLFIMIVILFFHFARFGQIWMRRVGLCLFCVLLSCLLCLVLFV